MKNKHWRKHKEPREGARGKYQNLSEGQTDKRWKKARERYQSFTAEEKEKKRQYHREHNKIFSEE